MPRLSEVYLNEHDGYEDTVPEDEQGRRGGVCEKYQGFPRPAFLARIAPGPAAGFAFLSDLPLF
jgi:hypothetical protein